MSRLFTARVQDGVIVADGLDLPEGATVTVAANDTETECELAPEELSELDAGIAEADRNETVPFEDVLADLDRIRTSASK